MTCRRSFCIQTLNGKMNQKLFYTIFIVVFSLFIQKHLFANYLWVVNSELNGSIYKLNKSDGSVVTSFIHPYGITTGISSDGDYLWIVNRELNGTI